MSATDKPISFDQDIKPLFREHDRDAMKWAFDLWSHGDVTANRDEILERLQDGSMPCDGAWPADGIAAFRAWMEAGSPG